MSYLDPNWPTVADLRRLGLLCFFAANEPPRADDAFFTDRERNQLVGAATDRFRRRGLRRDDLP